MSRGSAVAGLVVPSGNLDCLLGIQNGLSGMDAGLEWGGPVADRLYLPTADGGRATTDAVTETLHVVNIGRVLTHQNPVAPKHSSRCHFDLPDAVQGFLPKDWTSIPALDIPNANGLRPRGGAKRRHRRGTYPRHLAVLGRLRIQCWQCKACLSRTSPLPPGVTSRQNPQSFRQLVARLHVHCVSQRGLSRILTLLGYGVGAATLWRNVQVVPLGSDLQAALPL